MRREDRLDREAFENARIGSGIEVRWCDDVATCSRLLSSSETCVVVADERALDPQGIAVLGSLVSEGRAPVLLLVGSPADEATRSAAELGMGRSLDVQLAIEHPDLLDCAVRDALECWTLRQRTTELASSLAGARQALASTRNELRERTLAWGSFIEESLHEFRSSLTVIKEFGQILEDGLANSPEDQRTYLGYITEASDEILHMLTCYREGARIRCGLTCPVLVRGSAEGLWSAARAKVEVEAAERGVGLVTAIESALDPVTTDSGLTVFALECLLRRAIQVTSPGKQVVIWARPGSDGMVRLGCDDGGPTPGTEQLSQLSGEGYAGEGGRTHTIASVFGLGCQIAKEIADLNNGNLGFTPLPGGGVRCELRLPVLSTGE